MFFGQTKRFKNELNLFVDQDEDEDEWYYFWTLQKVLALFNEIFVKLQHSLRIKPV